MEETGVVVSASAGLTAPVTLAVGSVRLPVTEAGVRALACVSTIAEAASRVTSPRALFTVTALLPASPEVAGTAEYRVAGHTSLPTSPNRLASQ